MRLVWSRSYYPDESIPLLSLTISRPFIAIPGMAGIPSLLSFLENEYRPGDSPIRFVIPAPVKTVLKAGYHLKDGFIWSSIPYDKDDGLQAGEEDVEF